MYLWGKFLFTLRSLFVFCKEKGISFCSFCTKDEITGKSVGLENAHLFDLILERQTISIIVWANYSGNKSGDFYGQKNNIKFKDISVHNGLESTLYVC